MASMSTVWGVMRAGEVPSVDGPVNGGLEPSWSRVAEKVKAR